MATAIPIRNIYFLLCYAWNRLDEGAIIDVDHLPVTDLADLFAVVLSTGVDHLLRRGLEKTYESHNEELAGIRGRIDFSSSIRRNLFIQSRVNCIFDDLNSDTTANRIIRSTLKQLLRNETLDQELRTRVRRSIKALGGVRDIKVTNDCFTKVQVSSSRSFYAFLLSVCGLIHTHMLVDESTGNTKFRDFTRDASEMALLFQSFLANFMAKECRQWAVKADEIRWVASSETDPELSLLPRMRTDISVRRTGEYRIIDAKYYTRTLSSNYETEKIHIGNLYQIFGYLMNAPSSDGILPSGMLIYPRVDRQLRETYEILGRKVEICTVDLSAPWQEIRNEIYLLMQ